jgi:hypothetical protein
MYAELQKNIRLIDIKKENFFIHGSKVNGGERNTTSDIDLCVFKDCIFDSLERIYKNEIDFSNTYLSISKMKDEKISFHISDPSFRSSYTSTSISYELRPINNIKKNGNNSYYIPFTNDKGESYSARMICPQYKLNDYLLLNIIPQTGFYVLDNNKIYTDHFCFDLSDIYRQNKETKLIEKVLPFQDRVLLFGLEAHKCFSELSIRGEQNQDITKTPLLSTIAIFKKFLDNKDKYQLANHIIELLLLDTKVINQISKRNKCPELFFKSQYSRICNLI